MTARPHTAPSHRCRGLYGRGISLLELLVVITVLGTLAAVAAPRFTASLAGRRAWVGAARVAAVLDDAANAARANGEPRRVRFNTTSLTIAIDAPDPNDGSWRASDTFSLSTPPINITGIGVTLDPVTTDPEPAITFSGLGLPTSGLTVTIAADAARASVTLTTTQPAPFVSR